MKLAVLLWCISGATLLLACEQECKNELPNDALKQNQKTLRSCWTASESGVYKLKVPNLPNPIDVICEKDSFGYGWLVIQQRLDGSVNFNQSFESYKNGFGKVGLKSEFWLGLEVVHQLTALGECELAIEMRRRDNNEYFYARYTDFCLAGETTQYTMSRLGAYSGTAGDGLSSYNKYGKFVTYDRDFNAGGDLIAASTGGGWWFTTSSGSYLNSQNKDDFLWRNSTAQLIYSRMMIRTYQYSLHNYE